MTSRELVRRAIRFERPERLPIDLPEPYATDFAHVRINPSPDSRCSQGVDEWGADWHNIGVCNLGEVKDFPLKDWKDFDKVADNYGGPEIVEKSSDGANAVVLRPSRRAPVGILTGPYGARVLGPLVAGLARNDVRVIAVDNQFFGGNIGVTGLMVGEDIARVLADQPEGHRYLLPDVCLSQGRFLDGTTPDSLPRAVEVVRTDGLALRAALDLSPPRLAPPVRSEQSA